MKLDLNYQLKYPHSLISFEHFLHGDFPSLEEKPITDHELNEALEDLKIKKISCVVIKHISSSSFFEQMTFPVNEILKSFDNDCDKLAVFINLT